MTVQMNFQNTKPPQNTTNFTEGSILEMSKSNENDGGAKEEDCESYSSLNSKTAMEG